MIDFLFGRVLWLILIVGVAVLVAQNVGTVLSVLLAALILLTIARLLWPSPRR